MTEMIGIARRLRSSGQVGGIWESRPLLLLTTTGDRIGSRAPHKADLHADAAPSSSYRQPKSQPDVGAESTISELQLLPRAGSRAVDRAIHMPDCSIKAPARFPKHFLS